MKLLKIIRRDAFNFWDNNVFHVTWTKSWRGEYISRLKYPSIYDDFFDGFMECQKKDFQRNLYHDYWRYKKADYYKKYRKDRENEISDL